MDGDIPLIASSWQNHTAIPSADWRSLFARTGELWKRRTSQSALVLTAFDGVALLLALLGSLLIAAEIGAALTGRDYASMRDSGVATERGLQYALLLAGLLIYFFRQGHYTRRLPFWTEVKQVLAAICVFALIDGFIQFSLKTDFSRLWFAINWPLAFLFVIVARSLARRIAIRLGIWYVPAIVIGRSDTAAELCRALQSEPALGYKPVGQIDLAMFEAELEAGARSSRRSGAMSPPTKFLGEKAELAIFALSGDEVAKTSAAARLVEEAGIDVAVVPPLQGMRAAALELVPFFSHDVVMIRPRGGPGRRWPQMAKRAIDIMLVTAAIILFAPLLLTIAILVRLDGGEILFRHQRIGRNGKPFDCLKFRTMVPQADKVLAELLARDKAAAAEGAATFKLRNDPRITRIGRVLRASSLDELPQLFNVLRGEMSIVGPRPIVSAEISYYGDEYRSYLQVRPGITGLWQASGRSDVGYGRRVALDAWYVRNWCIWHDVAIICRTIPAVLKRKGSY